MNGSGTVFPVSAEGKSVYAASTMGVTGTRDSNHKTGYWVRGTTCFERRDGEWLVTHEHISMPAPMT